MDLIHIYHGLAESTLRASGLSDKMLHVHVGMALYLGAKLAIRTRRASILALVITCCFEISNEIADALFFGALRWEDTQTDMLATLFWPTMDFVVTNYRRARWRRVHLRRNDWGRADAGQDLRATA